MRSVPFCLGKEIFADREHSYVVDAWFGSKGWPDLCGRSCVIPRELYSMGQLTGEANVGVVRARRGVRWLYEHGWVEDTEDGGANVLLPRIAPYTSVSGKMARNLCRALTEDQMRAFLWLTNKRNLATRREDRCTVAPVWMVRDLGLREANGTTARVGRTWGELAEMGLIKTHPAPYGNMTVVDWVSKSWDYRDEDGGDAYVEEELA